MPGIVALWCLISPNAYAQQDSGQPLTLQETIKTAIVRNTGVRNAYLDRVVERYLLYVAESEFTPKFTLDAAVTRRGGTNGEASQTMSGTVSALQKLPTGATVTLRNMQDSSSSVNQPDTKNRSWTLTFDQPLLRGGGLDFATASVRQARLREQYNILKLKSTLTAAVTSAIGKFRSLVQSREQLEISRQSLQRSREMLDINRELIASKRMAQRDILQSEANVARQEVSLLSAENALDAARLELISFASLDITAKPIPVPETEIPGVHYERTRALEIALANRTDFMGAKLNLEQLRIAQEMARNGLLWMLNLSSNASIDKQGDKTWDVGLKLSIPFNDPSLKQQVLTSDIAIEQAERNLEQQRLDIAIAVDNALRKVTISRKQIDLARQSRTLSEQNLENVTEKLKVGRTSNFELLNYQDQLVTAQKDELRALMDYLGDVLNLEQTLGIVLEKWGIDLVERD